jgi:hypothetical protein
VLEAWSGPSGLHDRKEEWSKDRVIGLLEVEEGHNCRASKVRAHIGAQEVGENLHEHDVVTDEAARKEGRLLSTHYLRQDWG